MTSSYGPPPAPWGSSPPAAPQQETESKAIVALVLAVLAYTPTVPFIGAVAALVVARYAVRDIRASGGAKGGLGLVRAARVLAWVHLVLVALLFLVVLAIFLLPVSFAFVA